VTHTIIGNGRIFVHASTDSMPDKLPHDGKPISLDSLLNGRRYVSQPITDASLCNAFFQCRRRGLDQMVRLLADFTNREGHSRIPVELSVDDTKIQAHNIPFSHDSLRRRNTMNHFFIERNTNRRREWDGPIAYLIPLESGTDTFLTD